MSWPVWPEYTNTRPLSVPLPSQYGAPLTAFYVGPSAGRGYVFDGQTGTILQTYDGQSAQDYFGSSAGAAGDLDGDGLDDILFGAQWWHSLGTAAGRGYVFLTPSSMACAPPPATRQ